MKEDVSRETSERDFVISLNMNNDNVMIIKVFLYRHGLIFVTDVYEERERVLR